MLRLDRLKSVQGEFSLVANVEIAAPVTALIGPSGAGKSTILNLIAGFVAPSAGSIIYDGKDISDLPPAKRPVTMLFQDNNLFAHLNVVSNLTLAFPRENLPADASSRMERALKRVGLSGLESRKPAELSGGQQSRVALARVLLQDRPLMLLDEAFAALGPALKNEMLDLVSEVAMENSLQVIMISHDPMDAKRIATEACVVSEGTIAPPLPTAGLLENPPKALSDYLGMSAFITRAPEN